MKRLIMIILILLLTGCSRRIDVVLEDIEVSVIGEQVSVTEFIELSDLSSYDLGKIYIEDNNEEVLSLIIVDSEHLDYLVALFSIIVRNFEDEIRKEFDDINDIEAVYWE